MAAAAARWTLYACVLVLVLVGVLLALVESGWGKNQIRQLIVREANQYLTASLEIGTLGGSLLRGLHLGDVTLSRNGETLVHIDDVSLEYSINELLQRGTSIRRIRLTRPSFLVAREADGRWNMGALIRRESPRNDEGGPGRPLHIVAIEIADATVTLRDPLTFGAVHLPGRFEALDLMLAFDYEPGEWTLAIDKASWIGHTPDFSVGALSGTLVNGTNGWRFSDFVVETPESRVQVNGVLDRTHSPSVLHLAARADRFAFQEWARILPSISRIGVAGAFEAELDGPLAALATSVNLTSDGGDARGTVTLNTTVPGWRFAGDMTIARLDLSRWLSRPDDASDISGRVRFDLGVRPGASFPYGTYDFSGSHARFMGYAGDDVRARGQITRTEVRIAEATATAYGANVQLAPSTIGISSPYRYAFVGVADGVDLRQLPATVPVPHVESTLTLSYDVTGQFSDGFIVGTAAFDTSEFLGATIGSGATGFIDTASHPFRYAGTGTLSGVDLNRFGTDLDIGWLQDPRYAGTVIGSFDVEGSGSDLATMTLTTSGRLARASLFGGALMDAAVSLDIHDGSLAGSYDGQLRDVDPALAFGDERYASRLTGRARGSVHVQDLLVRSPLLDDYTVNAALTLAAGSRARGVDIERARIVATLTDSTLHLDPLDLSGPAIELNASGDLELDDERGSQIEYTIARSDLAQLREAIGSDVSGALTTTGRLLGPLHEMRVVGEGTLSRLETPGVKALTVTAGYDATLPDNDPARARASVNGRMSFVEAFNQQIQDVTGSVSYNAGRTMFDLAVSRNENISGTAKGEALIRVEDKTVDLSALALTFGTSSWTLVPPAASIQWDDRGVTVSHLAIADAAAGRQRVSADGTWYPDGGGSLHVTATDVSLDALLARAGEAAPRYGGTLTADATVRGSRAAPIVRGQIRIVDGRVWRTPVQQLAGRVDFVDDSFDVDLRLDQAPGIWLTAVGQVPLGLFVDSDADLPIDLSIASSRIGLGLIEGATSVVRNVAGDLQVNVTMGGTANDPQFDGRVDIANADFLVSSSGARYRNGRLAVQLGADRVTVEALHVEDADGHPLDVSGSLATRELRVGDLAVDARAKNFQVLRNQYGRMSIDATLRLRGQFESPRLEGQLTVTGGELAVDAILDRTLFQPYSTEAAAAPGPITDAIVALNPWERMGIGLELRVPGTLRLVGDNVQVSPGTPIGLGDINLRAVGDLYLYKDPAQPLYVTGSLDSVTGTYRFQGRGFDLSPSSSITFVGDLNPELYVTVEREISGVETRVTIAGPLREPELRLASTPPLDQSDILSLIVFNTSTNELSALQQQELAVRAGALAAGFLAAPIMSAIERSLGLDTLEIEPVAELGGAARVTIGNEIAPGLIARFSRQFGEFEYDEASLEYYLSRLFRIRATFSDARSLAVRYPFRRVERAGVDLLLFLSF
jgi:autotransporter translocation and assembly factor TamB